MRECWGCHLALVVPNVFYAEQLCGDRIEDLSQRRMLLNSEVLDRLLGSAWYLGDRITRELGWRPGVLLHDGLREMFGC